MSFIKPRKPTVQTISAKGKITLLTNITKLEKLSSTQLGKNIGVS